MAHGDNPIPTSKQTKKNYAQRRAAPGNVGGGREGKDKDVLNIMLICQHFSWLLIKDILMLTYIVMYVSVIKIQVIYR